LVAVDHNNKPLAVIEEDDVVFSLISEPIGSRINRSVVATRLS
jgi:hypothetical protein